MYQLCWYPEGAARIYLDQWSFSLPQCPAQRNVASVKLLRTAWTMDTFSQPGGKRGFQNFTIVNNAVNTYPLQLHEAAVSISLSFSSILSVGINIGCRRPPRLSLLDSPVQKFNYTLQNLTHVGLVSVNIAFHNISKTPLFPAYIWSFDQFWAL